MFRGLQRCGGVLQASPEGVSDASPWILYKETLVWYEQGHCGSTKLSRSSQLNFRTVRELPRIRSKANLTLA